MDKWISVEDGLMPDSNAVMLVCLCNSVVSTGHWNQGKQLWRPNHQLKGVLEGVTHWQPLPEPPGGGWIDG